MEKLKKWFQKARKPFDNWMFYRQIDKLTGAIYKYAFKDSSSHHTREDALNVAKAIIWNDEEIRKIIGDLNQDFKGGIIMEKYFDIHVTYGNKDGDGYSIPIIANSKEDAKQRAINERLFEYEDDVNDIDYIEEITKDEYSEMKE